MAAMQAPYYGSYTYPGWANAVGWFIAVFSLFPIPICFVKAILDQEGTLVEVCVSHFKEIRIKHFKTYQYFFLIRGLQIKNHMNDTGKIRYVLNALHFFVIFW